MTFDNRGQYKFLKKIQRMRTKQKQQEEETKKTEQELDH